MRALLLLVLGTSRAMRVLWFPALGVAFAVACASEPLKEDARVESAAGATNAGGSGGKAVGGGGQDSGAAGDGGDGGACVAVGAPPAVNGACPYADADMPFKPCNGEGHCSNPEEPGACFVYGYICTDCVWVQHVSGERRTPCP